MKQTSHDREARDAAFDEQVRSMLSEAAVPAPAASETLFAPVATKAGLWGKLGLAAIGGLFLWGAFELAGNNPSAPSVLTPIPASISASPSAVTGPSGPAMESSERPDKDGMPDQNAAFEAGGEGGDIAPSTAKPNLAAEPTAVLGSEAISASGSESTTVAAEATEKAALSTSDPVSGAEEGPRADAVSPSPDPAAIKAEPASLPEEPKAPSATQDEQQDANQPTLTLPLTLPSGGGH
jgi:hypothetical protein